VSALPVLLPAADRLARAAQRERALGFATFRLEASHGMILLVLFVAGCGIAQAQGGVDKPSVLDTLLKWTPVLAKGFVFNLAISFLAMAIGTVAGFFLGAARISLMAAGAGRRLVHDQLLQERALAGAALLLHAPASLPGESVSARPSPFPTGPRPPWGSRSR
jgi:ABC-type amino acid transport system permease subunit